MQNTPIIDDPLLTMNEAGFVATINATADLDMLEPTTNAPRATPPTPAFLEALGVSRTGDGTWSALERLLGERFAIAFDIETVPLAASLEEPYPSDRKHPANYKDPDKIDDWYTRDQAEWKGGLVKRCSLDPRKGRVLAIGLAVHGYAIPTRIAATEAEESTLLADVWRILTNVDNGLVVSFAGQPFDLPFMVHRSLLLDVVIPPKVISWLRRYTYSPHLDVQAALNNWQTKEGTLDDWCRAFDLPTKPDGLNGGEVYNLYLKQDWEAIGTYAQHDAMSALRLAERVGQFYLS